MDIQSFIQSGLLEAYVAGQCTPAEQQEVLRMAAKHPEIKAELASIEQALEKIAQATAITPPAGLRDRILDHIDKLPEMPTATGTGSGSSNSVGFAGKLYPVLALGLAAIAAYLLWQGMQKSAEIQQLQNRAAALQIEIDDCSTRRQQTEPMAALLRDTDTKPVTLTDGKAYNITVFNNTLRKECALDISGLPAPEPGQYFQAWAIVEGEAAPVSLGMVRLNAVAGWQPLPYMENVIAYAISVEDKPEGNPTPTQVLASGGVI